MGECKLQAPTSSTMATQSDIINGFTNSNFYVADGDKVAFNQSGGSQRTELRDLRNWDLTVNDQQLFGRIDIVQQTCDQVTVMQIHDDANAGNGPNKPLLRIYKHQTKSPVNHIWAAIKTDAGGQATTHIDLGADPGGYFDCEIQLVGGNMIIKFQGVEKVNMDVSYWDWPSYWKAGVYLQDNGEATAHFDELYEGSGGGTGNSAPSVSITSPSNGATFNNGDNVSISANAADSDGSVSQVEFFVNGSSVGVDTSSPYSINWTIGVGSYDITAVATDNASASTTSSVVSVTGTSSGPATNTYVSAIVTGTQGAGKGKKHGTATVTILDNNGSAVANATVTGTFSGTFNETVSGSTDSNGTVELVTSSTAKGGVSVNLCVDDVTHASLVYNSSLNVVTCAGASARLGGPLDESKKDVALGIYPNPTFSSFTLDIMLDKESFFDGRLLGMDGRVLRRIEPHILSQGNHQLQVDVDGLKKGVYFFEYTLDGKTQTSRIIKR
ncbi:polysaccharide lyase family 7 protein [Marinoscillum sp. 108]|uniref:polysaccharide lyase family 7 protein n=1 Tax=Marinoscillum sp. 108 TaxID=2653151 RepID=UPI001C88BA4D|nr:polysaccharide lyase family 7 protein [Marinoscillum sp. 108]